MQNPSVPTGRRASSLLLSTSVFGLLTTFAATAAAQSPADTAPVQVTQAQGQTETDVLSPSTPVPSGASVPEAAAGDSEETVVVTGSRLRRSTFTSVSPLQVVDGERSRELGLTSTDDILQVLNVVGGPQIDTSLSGGFVTDNGPGSATIGLRNLDPERTLLLINGLRVAPAGVEGAPTSPDISLIPSSLIERAEVLLDGASSIYGSDAVAGVVNVVLRKDYEGFEVNGTVNYPTDTEGQGRTYNVSALGGYAGDGFNIMGAVEYEKVDRLTVGGRDFGNECPNGKNREIDLNTGKEYNFDPRWGTDCYVFGATYGWVSTPVGGRYYTPGVTNDPVYGIPNWSRTRRIGPNPGDEAVYIFSEQYQRLSQVRNSDLEPGIERISFYATGDAMLDESSNMEAFFEVSYNQREQHFVGTLPQLFTSEYFVPASNPFNPFGDDVQPVLGILNDRVTTDVEVDQVRSVVGVRGDISPSWRYEASFVYSHAKGTSKRYGYRSDLLELSVFTTEEIAPGVFACGADVDPSLPDCVPVNLFSDSAMRLGMFSPEEEAFLYDSRNFETTTEQILFNAFVAGDLFELDGGAAGLVAGIEYRDDRLESIPSINAREGRIQNFFQDSGATGSASIFEVFAEAELPFLKDVPGADELTVNLSGRYSDQEYYGTAWTYSAKALWKPVEWVTLRGTFGTSYRAPNLREFFLAGQTGFVSGALDPCLVPDSATELDPVTNLPVYDPTGDQRSPEEIANCQAEGIDPFSLGLTTGSQGIEVVSGGSRDLSEEESEAFSVGFVVEQPFWDDVDLRFGLNYYEIEVTNSIEEPSESFIVEDCYQTAGGTPFCDRITRFNIGGEIGQISQIDASFLNIGVIETRGLDYNFYYGQSVDLFGTEVDLALDASASQTLEYTVTTFEDPDELEGRLGAPKWRGTIDASAQVDTWRLLWRARYIGSQSDMASANPAFDTCSLTDDPPITARDPDCTSGENRVEKTFADSQWLHTVALSYVVEDQWSATLGIENLFDQEPEFLDPDVSSNAEVNVNIDSTGAIRGMGYDFYGRRVYLRLNASF